MPDIDKIAWIHLRDGAILSTRSHHRDAFYLPGGKREPGESDLDTLVREIREELTVAIDPSTAAPAGIFEAQAHAHPQGIRVRMTCYTATYSGTLTPAAEIAELAWLTYADRNRVSPVDKLIFDQLRDDGQLH
ncbi:NUDIX domain-containing protein [Actinoplanes sp. NPDC089786]|uniref:NUDIX hydrolase n=1 Tax=Actinoplanes sp. NPDC089786 TaxID=3155185 RepID=UPI003424CC43